MSRCPGRVYNVHITLQIDSVMLTKVNIENTWDTDGMRRVLQELQQQLFSLHNEIGHFFYLFFNIRFGRVEYLRTVNCQKFSSSRYR